MSTPCLTFRRWCFFGAVVSTTLLGSFMMLDIVRAAGVTLLEIGILGLFVPTFAWISLAFWNAVVGFVLLLLRRDPISLAPFGSRDAAAAPLTTRTAIVMPARNEDPERVVGGLAAVLRSLDDTGCASHFDVHLLSDTSDAEIARAEEERWTELRKAVARPRRLHYRRRRENVGRKAGNIRDFLERRGAEYDFMVVLDADSVMGGPALVRLVRAMEADPSAGIIQTVPIPIRQESAFGRFVQFAGALYAPMLAAGQAFWQGESANYWGHNAIVRVQPFLEHARLPVLAGTPPLGGPVLSHDFVEAALLRRAGWKVYLDTGLGGSWEEVPTNVLDFAARDRRWAQGSLQHLRLLREPGLVGLSRLHFVTGAMGYLASTLWLLLLVASTAYVVVPALSADPFFSGEGGFGRGPWSEVATLMPLLAMTAAVLFVPKVLGVALALLRRRERFGGALRLAVGATLEALFSILIAPLMMMLHTIFVLEIVAGRDVAWEAQARADREISWAEAWARGRGVTAVGFGWAALTLAVSPPFFLWLSPIFAGLLLAIPSVRWSSSVRGGRALRRHGILLTPTESRLPPELRLPERPRGTRKTMHQAERAMFDLQRGRPVLVGSSTTGDTAAVVCVAVEGIDAERLAALKRLGSGGIRLIVTPRRAAAMRVPLDDVAASTRAVGFGLDGETAAELFGLSSALGGFDVEGLEAEPATEAEAAALALAHFGRLLPAVVCVPARPDSVSELAEALESGAMLRVSATEVVEMTSASASDVVVSHVSAADVPLEEAEDARFMLFREGNGLYEHVAVLIGDPDRWPDPVPVRLHSACLTGDLFGSLKCDCGEQLRRSLHIFASSGGGVLLYLQQEGRGIGLGNKLRAYALQQDGLDTVDADEALGFGGDERRYDAAVGMLRHLGIERVRIFTNNPAKVRALEEGGIDVLGREPLHGTLNRYNLPYVRAKVQRAGHWLGEMLHGSGPGA